MGERLAVAWVSNGVGGPSDAVKTRMRLAERELQKARFLQATAGPAPKASVRSAIKAHEAIARRLLREAEDLARSEDDSAWFEAAIMETEGLALARGELVGRQTGAGGRSGPLVMLSRGLGLEYARDNGYLAGAHGRDETDDLYATGQRYQAAYETVEGKVGKRGEGAGGFGPKGPQIRAVEAGQMLAVMRSDLGVKQRKVLDAVCGEGLGLDHAARVVCGMGAPALRNALRGGLRCALDALRKSARAKREDRGGDQSGDLVERLASAHEAVARAGRGL